jgi:hypothetical protein
MKNVFATIATLALFSLFGCTSGIEIVNEGDVYSSSGNYQCSTETSPCTYATANAIDEWFAAYPRSGFMFAGWRNCPSPTSNSCHVSLSQSTIEAHYGETWPNLMALFAPIGSIPVKVKSCTVGPNMANTVHCRPHIGKVLFINRQDRNGSYPDYEASSIQIVGFDNVVYTGGYAGMYKVDLGDSSSDGLFIVGPHPATLEVVISKSSKSYPCQGLDGCAITIGAVAL